MQVLTSIQLSVAIRKPFSQRSTADADKWQLSICINTTFCINTSKCGIIMLYAGIKTQRQVTFITKCKKTETKRSDSNSVLENNGGMQCRTGDN